MTQGTAAQQSLTPAEILESWAGLEAIRGKIQRVALSSHFRGALFPLVIVDAANNLPFLHAYSVLAEALQLRADRGDFSYKPRGRFQSLQRMFDAAANLKWCGHRTLIKVGITRRNELAHKGALLPRRECWDYIDAIGDVLREWGFIGLHPTAKRAVSPPKP
jgi:hypothetical protein